MALQRRSLLMLLWCTPLWLALSTPVWAAPGDESFQRNARAARDAIKITANIPYASTDNPRQQLDLFLPRNRASDKPLPIVAFIHGGGWRKGDRRSGLPFLAPFLSSGKYAGASIGYRLTDEASWPAQIHDCKAAIRWLRSHAEEYGLDPNHLAVIGTSAGGHLVAMLGTSGDVADLEGDLGDAAGTSSRVTCVVDFFGPSDLTTMGEWHERPDSPESLLLGGPILDHQERAVAASPIQYTTGDDPPFLIVHGTADPLVPFEQSVQLRKALEKAGASATLIPIEGGGHGRFNIQALNTQIERFLANHLLGANDPVSPKPIPLPSR